MVKKMKALLKRFGAPGALQYLTFVFLAGAAFFDSEGKVDGIGAARAAAAAAVAAALKPPALAFVPNSPLGNGGGRGGGPKSRGAKDGRGGGPSIAATGAAGAGAGAEDAGGAGADASGG